MQASRMVRNSSDKLKIIVPTNTRFMFEQNPRVWGPKILGFCGSRASYISDGFGKAINSNSVRIASISSISAPQPKMKFLCVSLYNVSADRVSLVRRSATASKIISCFFAVKAYEYLRNFSLNIK